MAVPPGMAELAGMAEPSVGPVRGRVSAMPAGPRPARPVADRSHPVERSREAGRGAEPSGP